MRAIADYGDYVYWDDGALIGAEAYFNKYYNPYLSIVKSCNDKCGYELMQPWLQIDGTRWSYSVFVNNFRQPVILSDGTLVVFSTLAGTDKVSSNNFIYFDINGNKKPNKLGRDTFILIRDKSGIRPYGYNMDNAVIDTDCSKNGAGFYCAAKIMKDGWTIKDDYPW